MRDLRARLWAVLLHPAPVNSAWWIALALAFVAVDFFVGPYVQFAAAFIIPVALAAWFSSPTIAIVLALTLPLTRLAMLLTVWDEPWDPFAMVTTAALRMMVFLFAATTLGRLATHERDLEREVDLLEGLLPICMHCKSIRNELGEWEKLERYISTRSEATFTHGLCATCAEQHYPEYATRSVARRVTPTGVPRSQG